MFYMFSVFTQYLLHSIRQMPTYRSSMGKYFYSSYPPIETTTAQYASDMGNALGLIIMLLAFSALFTTIGYFISNLRDTSEDTQSGLSRRVHV
jgi:hypothetical protein